LIALAIGCGHPAAPAPAPADRQVTLTGVYSPIAVRQGARSAEDDAKATTVELVTDDHTSIMLGVYYEPSGQRDRAEISQLAGKRVRVTGMLHEHTPPSPTVIQMMTGPWIAVTTVELAPQ
jgi:hypothetical protein